MSRAGLWERILQWIEYRPIPIGNATTKGYRYPATGTQPEVSPVKGPAHRYANNYYYTRDIARDPKHLENMRISLILSRNGTPNDIQPAFVSASGVLKPFPPATDAANALPEKK